MDKVSLIPRSEPTADDIQYILLATKHHAFGQFLDSSFLLPGQCETSNRKQVADVLPIARLRTAFVEILSPAPTYDKCIMFASMCVPHSYDFYRLATSFIHLFVLWLTHGT